MKISPLIFVLFAITACDAGHLGNPATLPVRGAIAGIENASYNQRRGEVKSYIADNLTCLQMDLRTGADACLGDLYKTAGTADAKQSELGTALKQDAISGTADLVERMTVTVMVHS